VFDVNGVGLPPGEGPVVTITYVIQNVIEPTTVNLMLTDVVVSDLLGFELPATPHSGLLEVLVETQYLIVGEGRANPGETDSVEVYLTNTKTVGGFEFIIRDVPDYVDGVIAMAAPRLTEITSANWQVVG
jgi:hypothetical protein